MLYFRPATGEVRPLNLDNIKNIFDVKKCDERSEEQTNAVRFKHLMYK